MSKSAYAFCRLVCAAMALVGAVASSALAWTSVAPGIEYQEFLLPDPNHVYVARMDRDNTQCFVDSTLGGGRLGLSETIGGQASRYDEAISYWDRDWGKRNDVIVAINGDFPDTTTNTPASGQVMSGWYTKALPSSSMRFYYTPDQLLAIGSCGFASQRVHFASGSTMSILGINRTRGSSDLVVYTPQYHRTTRTDNSGVEVLVEMTRPAMLLPSSDPALGFIRQIRQNAGSTSIPFDHVVISATGAYATELLARSQVGDRLGLSFNFEGNPVSMKGTYATIGGGENFLASGMVMGGQDVRHPRTAIAHNDRYLYFVVVDGRSTVSVGMTMAELGFFCRDYLGATWGINQDGGGSSTMIVNGVLKNDPSDGSQRAVINGIFMGRLQPKQHSTAFSSGDIVRTTSGTVNVRLGPGTNYLVLTSIGNRVEGAVLDHHLRGIYAKGEYWWKCNFNGTTGWVAQSLLTLVSAGNLPRFTQHPAALHVCPGQSGSFTVAVSGAGPFTYRWQFNGIDLEDGGVYGGTTTPTLSVTNPSAAQTGSYRCVVTDSNGSTTSWSAPLRIMVSTAILTQPTPQTDPVMRGTDVVFSVRAGGEAPLSYRWQKNGQAIYDSGEYSGTSTPTLTVHSVTTEEEGEYRCVVTGGCGAVASDGVGLTVLTPDFDRDSDVDQSDFGFLQACFSGSTIPQTDPACLGANLDGDAERDVDPADLAVFLQCFSGPEQPRPPGC